jgi:amidase
MMIGDIYVTPAGPCTNPDRNGGNMDFKDVCAGNTLYLRAERGGGMLVLGDVHACQGDGEILGLGAECAADVRIRITKDETYLPMRPMIRKPSSFVCISTREEDYAAARDEAADDAARIFSRITGVGNGEALLYCRTVGDLRNGAVWMLGGEKVAWRRMVTVGLEVPLFEWGPL